MNKQNIKIKTQNYDRPILWHTPTNRHQLTHTSTYAIYIFACVQLKIAGKETL